MEPVLHRFNAEEARLPDDSAATWKRLFLDLVADRPEALERLYDLAADRLYGLALWRTGSSEDAREVLQEVFVRVLEQRERLGAVRRPSAWLFTVAHRIAVDLERRRRRRRAEPLDNEPLLVSTFDADRAVDAGRASALLRALPPGQREVIYLRHFAGCTFAEAGRILGIPTFTAASRYRLGMRKLRRRLGGTP